MKQSDITTDEMLQNQELEEMVIGSIVQYSEHLKSDLPRLFMTVTEDDFYNTSTSSLFKTLKAMYDNGMTINTPNVLHEAIKSGVGMDVVARSLQKSYPGSSALLLEGIPNLKDYSTRRKLWIYGKSLVSAGQSLAVDSTVTIDGIIKSLLEIQGNNNSAKSILTGNDIAKNIIRTVDRNRQEGIDQFVTRTGFPDIDKVGGLCATDLCIIGAATSMGKSSLVINIAANAMKAGKKVAYYSYEMTYEQVVSRMLAPDAKISQYEMLRTELSDVAVKMVDDAVVAFSEYGGNFIAEEKPPRTLNELKNSIRYLHKVKGVDGVVVDYLGLIAKEDSKQSTQEHLANCARELKNLALELHIWIVALVQFNRSKDDDSTPSLDRLRDSAQIADAADTVILIHRPGKDGKNYAKPYENVNPEGTALILIEKNRNAARTSFICGYKDEFTLFYPIDKVPTIACNAVEEKKRIEDERPF